MYSGCSRGNTEQPAPMLRSVIYNGFLYCRSVIGLDVVRLSAIQS